MLKVNANSSFTNSRYFQNHGVYEPSEYEETDN